MKLIVSLILMTFAISRISAQGCCKDSTTIPDTYFICNTPEYIPVCGCDNITYRNSCAAEHWGGLINNGFCLGWIEGTICGNFDFDFIPSGIRTEPVQFSLYMKQPGSASLYIYSQYGGLMMSEYFNASFPDQILERELNFQGLEIGIYFAEVVVNGEHLTKKFGKVQKTTQ